MSQSILFFLNIILLFQKHQRLNLIHATHHHVVVTLYVMEDLVHALPGTLEILTQAVD